MNVILSTDSTALENRLSAIFSDIPNINLVCITKDLNEAQIILSNSTVQVFITAFHKVDKSIFKKLKEIKDLNTDLIIIVLNNNPADQYLNQWRDSGADYIFDQAMDFSAAVDVLSGLIYKHFLQTLRVEKSNRNHEVIEKNHIKNS